MAAISLPSSIYPPLQFPRIVIIAHSGTLPSESMMLTVTRPIEQADHGSARDSPGAIRPASEAPPRFPRSSTRPRDMVVALQQLQNRVSEIRNDLPADTELTVERLTPAIFPVFILSLTGSLPTPDLNDYAHYVMRPALARVPGAGHIEVLASDTREIEVVLEPMKLALAGLTVTDVSETLKAQNQLRPVGQFSESGQQHLSLASGLWTTPDRDRRGARADQERRDHPSRPISARSFPDRPTARCSSPATDATPSPSASRSRSAPTSST